MCGPYTLAIILGLAAGGVVLLLRPGDALFAVLLGLIIAAATYVTYRRDERRRG